MSDENLELKKLPFVSHDLTGVLRQPLELCTGEITGNWRAVYDFLESDHTGGAAEGIEHRFDPAQSLVTIDQRTGLSVLSTTIYLNKTVIIIGEVAVHPWFKDVEKWADDQNHFFPRSAFQKELRRFAPYVKAVIWSDASDEEQKIGSVREFLRLMDNALAQRTKGSVITQNEHSATRLKNLKEVEASKDDMFPLPDRIVLEFPLIDPDKLERVVLYVIQRPSESGELQLRFTFYEIERELNAVIADRVKELELLLIKWKEGGLNRCNLAVLKI